ncbi:ROT1 protein [Rhodotorula toruloides]|uniref:ROT1 protein n=1 Tax=Rhodotorula toruloides TaxID=5286 RepID=A0A511KLC0_RHOTO|nr:ROT1 protein [Rhodotorula toruloides]
MNNDRPFIYPANTGIAYSFTDNGYFEMAQYRFNANGDFTASTGRLVAARHCESRLASPRSPASSLTRFSPQYALHPNGSLTMDPSPFAMDGRVQTQNPCSPTTNVLTEFAQFELWNSWQIGIDVNHAAYSLQAVDVNGKKPRMFLTVRPPTMLPTASLTGIFNGSIPLTP